MFNCFKGHLNWDDFYAYFVGACFKHSDSEVGVLGDPCSIFSVERNLFGGRPEQIRLGRELQTKVVNNPSLFDFPPLGYFPINPEGLIGHASIHPTDQLRRGFNPTRVLLDHEPNSLSFHMGLGKAPVNLNLSGAFGALHNMSKDIPRYTPFDIGIEKMWAGEIIGFVTNPKTCVVLNPGVDNSEYPALILHNGAEVGQIRVNKSVVSVSPKIDVNCMIRKAA